jgi:hypothetical protein
MLSFSGGQKQCSGSHRRYIKGWRGYSWFPVLALVGRLGWQLIGLSTLLVFLTIVQIMLPSLRGNASWIAALHPVNALALMGISATIRRYGRAEALQVN